MTVLCALPLGTTHRFAPTTLRASPKTTRSRAHPTVMHLPANYEENKQNIHKRSEFYTQN